MGRQIRIGSCTSAMKIHVLSDLHLEFADFQPPATDADVVVLAGDISVGSKGIAWAEAHFHVPVIYVAGNHEYYKRDLMLQAELRERAVGRVHFLDHDQVIIDGVRFLGATLWTDFLLFGEERKSASLAAARQHILDFRLIRDRGAPFTPERSIELHRHSRAWLATQLHGTSYAGTTVVVTHHGPHWSSVHARWRDDLCTPGFVSDLEELLGAAPLWIHGHTHDSFDYQVNGTRVVCNPRGYARAEAPDRQENTAFAPDLVVTV
jgi:predicted phosphodiesterase